jgi:hypothetical protein
MDVKTENIGELRCNFGAFRQALTPSLRKPCLSPSKNEPFRQEMRLKIPFSNRAFILPNSKPGCRVSALHFFVK